MKFGLLYGGDLALSSWRGSLDAKLSVSVRIDLMLDINTGSKTEIRRNALVFKSIFLSLSWDLALP